MKVIDATTDALTVALASALIISAAFAAGSALTRPTTQPVSPFPVSITETFSDGTTRSTTNPALLAEIEIAVAAAPQSHSSPLTQAASQPAIAWHVCPASMPAYTNGFEVDSSAAPVAVADVHYQGYNDGVIIQNAPQAVLSNIRTVGSWRNPATALYGGQGVYIRNVGAAGRNSITGWFAWGNGYDASQKWWECNLYRHDGYFDEGSSPIDVNEAIFANGSTSACQFRTGNPAPSTLSNAFITGKGVAVLATYGPLVMSHCTVYGGHFCWDGQNWTLNEGIGIYWPVVLNDVWFVGEPRQGIAPTIDPRARAYPQGCIVFGGTWVPPAGHTWSAPPAGARLLTATNCRIAGWPGAAFTNVPAAQQTGFTVTANPVAYDPRPVLLAVHANRMSIADAQAKLQSDVRAMVH